MSDRATIASVARELRQQPSLLDSFQRSATWSSVEKDDNPVLVGAGDSYAASLCASFLAGPQVVALDPYSLAESIGWAKGRHVYVISISGQTRANIELVRDLKGVAKRVTAVTSNPESGLATEVDGVIELPFKPPTKSPGIASFTLSLAAVLKVCGLDPDCNFEDLLSRASAESKRVHVARGGNVTYFAANNEAYAASIYGVAKLYELLGCRAQASLLEEFSHMPLFSLSALDTVNVIGSPEGRKEERLCERLKDSGYASSLIRPEGSRIERLYLLVFALQMTAIDAAKKRGLLAPYFLGAKKKLRISDAMIY